MKRRLLFSALAFALIGQAYAQEKDKDKDDNNTYQFDPIVVSGTLRPVSKTESAVPVEVYTKAFFKQNPTPSFFETLDNVNGIRPQVNCNVCNTGDIHINGLEGANTMVLIDGMPIVSGLSTVYGFSGIPEDLIERVEIVKGPASTLYGSEAIGGLINIITKNALTAPLFSVNSFASSWQEYNVDVTGKFNAGDKASSLLGVNYFNYNNPIDKNGDNFTDLTLQNRISVFNKWDFQRENNRVFSLAGRYLYEDRWGGEMDWEKKYRGTDIKYGESIYTSRWETFGKYQLPTDEKIFFDFSLNGHHQDSYYGDAKYLADQEIYFGQLTWHKNLDIHNLLFGAAYRYTKYHDANAHVSTVAEQVTHLPGVFVQDEMEFNRQNKLLVGLRYDHNSIHGNIFSPRLNYKWNTEDKSDIIRLSLGNGYRVANVFTEDHQSLTSSREVVFKGDLKPEVSWNGNFDYVKNIYTDGGHYFNLNLNAFYTYFENKIIGDIESSATQIIYDNLGDDDYAISKGISLSVNGHLKNGLSFNLGGTYMDVYSVEDGEKEQQLFTENFSGVWSIGYEFRNIGLKFDYTGNLRSPMRLPLIEGPESNDTRPDKSPWYSIQNIQLTKKFNNGLEIYGGVKNLLDFTPYKYKNIGDKLIARAHDPFDEHVVKDGDIIKATSDNPNGLEFSPEYVYSTNQGIRGFLGIRYTIK
ncbi:TonB-dependent receptor [Weeksellaceae bacterium TAE3-ERU29]|nr:TonB-dependent receptor [Weeksellaceae bacterium TAE3-ERU29]